MTKTFYDLVAKKLENPNQKVDWSIILWEDWKKVLPEYLVESIEKVQNNNWQTAPYIFDCYLGAVYGYISLAVRDKAIIWEQADCLREKYVYSLMDTRKVA